MFEGIPSIEKVVPLVVDTFSVSLLPESALPGALSVLLEITKIIIGAMIDVNSRPKYVHLSSPDEVVEDSATGSELTI